MITGKDLVIYILENDLLNEPICTNGKLLGFYTESEAAVAFGVGRATIRIWIERGEFDAILIGDRFFIPKTSKNPLERNKDEKSTSNTGGVSANGVNQYDATGQSLGNGNATNIVGGISYSPIRRGNGHRI